MVDKVLQRIAGKTQQYTPATTSSGAASAGKLVALGSDGKLDSSMYNSGSGTTTQSIVASEALSAGAFVNKWSNSGVINVRLADNSNSRPAHGFVLAAVASGANATVQPMDGLNTAMTGLTPGVEYFLGTAGGVVTALDATTATTGTLDQKLGVAYSATELDTEDYDYVVL